MADMTLCDRADCPSRDRCLRALAAPNPEMQSYFAPPYEEIVRGKCKYYTEVVPRGGKQSGQIILAGRGV